MTTPTQTGDKPMVTQRAIELLERAHAKGGLGYEAHGAIEYAINVLRHREQETREQSRDVGREALATALQAAIDEHADLGRLNRDYLGREVREAWVKWAMEQPNPKPHWLLPFDDLDEPDKEVDRQIGVKLARIGVTSFVAGHRHLWAKIRAALSTPLASPEQPLDTLQRLGQEFDGEQPRLGREALEALVQHNERLRSAVAIADRDGADTNWKAFRGQCRYTLAEYQDIVNEARADLARAALSPSPDLAEENERLRPMEDAPKDGRYIIAAYRSLDGYAEQLHGRSFIIRHEGTTPSGYDLGWALFPGHGGVPDKCFSGWLPLPTTLQSISTANGGPGRDGVS